MDIYQPSLLPQYKHCPNCWSVSRRVVDFHNRGDYCSAKYIGPRDISVTLSMQHWPPCHHPTSFWELMKKWGHSWMWEQMRIVGDDDWISAAITNNCFIAVTDGSYMMEMYPQLNSAAFVLECRQGRERLMGSFMEDTPEACSY
jgi:hypothetical protein